MLKKPIQLLVVDLDDTLLDNHQRISARNVQALQAARQAGVHVMIATGRMYASAVPYAQELGLTGPMVLCQGAAVQDIQTGAPLRTIGVPVEMAREVARFFEERGIYVQYYSRDDYYYEKYGEPSEYYERTSRVVGIELGRPASQAIDFEPIKLVAIDDPPRIRALYPLAYERFGASLEVTTSKSRYLEFSHNQATKGNGVRLAAQMLGIPPEAIMAIGDNLNDASMLRMAGMGVAVANAPDALRRIADYVTGTNMQNGVAQAVDRFILGRAK